MKIKQLLLMLFMLILAMGSVSAYDTWYKNDSLVSGLYASFDQESLEIWEYGGTTYAVVQGFYGSSEQKGYRWNETAWVDDPVAINGLSVSDSYYLNDPAIFEVGDQIHMVITDSSDVRLGFTWNGAGWTSNNTVQNGIADYGNSGNSDTFYYDDKVFIMVSAGNGHTCYEWQDNVWVRNTTFEAGYVNGYNPRPMFYRLFDDLFQITVGSQNGGTTLFQGYIWNNTALQWDFDPAILSGIGAVGFGNGVIVEFNDKMTFFSSEWNGADADRHAYVLPTNLAEKPRIIITENQRDNIPIFNTSFSLTHSEKNNFNCSLRKDANILDSIENAAINTTYYLSTTNVSLGINSFNMFCNDAEVERTTNIQYDYDNSTPFIYPISPSSFNTTIIGGSSSLLFKVNVSDGDLDKINYSIFYPNGSLFWNQNNLDVIGTDYLLDTSIDITGIVDGNYKVYVEATDEQQVQDLGGLNNADIWYQFKIDNCQNDWQCNEYSECTVLNLQFCSNATDLNNCGEEPESIYSISPQACIYVPPKSGSGGSSFSSINPTPVTDQEINFESFSAPAGPTTFSISGLDVDMPEFVQDIIDWFQNLEWNSEVFE